MPTAIARSRPPAQTRHFLDQLHAFDGERALVAQRIQQPPLIGVSNGPGLSLSIPITPMAPRPVCMGRNRRLAPGSVSEPRPAARSFSQAHFAAARSASSSVSSGG